MDGQIIPLATIEHHVRQALRDRNPACPYAEGTAAAQAWRELYKQLTGPGRAA